MATFQKRTGLPTIRSIAYTLCRLLSKFGPIIRLAYPDNATLQAALIAAEEACHTLVAEADAQLPVGT